MKKVKRLRDKFVVGHLKQSRKADSNFHFKKKMVRTGITLITAALSDKSSRIWGDPQEFGNAPRALY